LHPGPGVDGRYLGGGVRSLPIRSE
jgi:hypothetical protein